MPACLDKIGSHQQTADHGDVDCKRESAEQILITEDVGHVVNTHTECGGEKLRQDVDRTDDDVVFVCKEQLCSVEQ